MSHPPEPGIPGEPDPQPDLPDEYDRVLDGLTEMSQDLKTQLMGELMSADDYRYQDSYFSYLPEQEDEDD